VHARRGFSCTDDGVDGSSKSDHEVRENATDRDQMARGRSDKRGEYTHRANAPALDGQAAAIHRFCKSPNVFAIQLDESTAKS
jgi:hypothetical protein